MRRVDTAHSGLARIGGTGVKVITDLGHASARPVVLTNVFLGADVAVVAGGSRGDYEDTLAAPLNTGISGARVIVLADHWLPDARRRDDAHIIRGAAVAIIARPPQQDVVDAPHFGIAGGPSAAVAILTIRETTARLAETVRTGVSQGAKIAIIAGAIEVLVATHAGVRVAPVHGAVIVIIAILGTANTTPGRATVIAGA